MSGGQINPRFLQGGYVLRVAGYAPSGPLYLAGPTTLTSHVLDVPGVPMHAPAAGVMFMAPDPEWLHEQQASPDGEWWTVTHAGFGGAEIAYRIPAMWGLRIDTNATRVYGQGRSRLSAPPGDEQGTGS